MQQQRTASQLGGDEMKRGFYMTAGDDQLSGWTEKELQSTSQSQTCSKKSHGHCLVICCLSDH